MKSDTDVQYLLDGYVDIRDTARKQMMTAERLYSQGRLTEAEYERIAAEFESAARVVIVLMWVLDKVKEVAA